MLKSLSGAACGILLAVAGTALAQTYPARPLTMIIPFAAGGPTDVLGRVMAQRMGEILGQQVVVENVGGAGGMTGSKRVVDAAPDGYTFVLGTVGTHAQSQTMYKKPLYNTVADFTPVALIAEVPIVLITRKDLPVNDLKEFIAYAKANFMTKERSSALPNVPTGLEQGTPNLEAYTWNAIFLPKDAPADVVKKLNDATVQAMKTPAVRERLEGLGAVIVPEDRATPEYLGQFVKSEIEKWAGPIKASGVTVD